MEALCGVKVSSTFTYKLVFSVLNAVVIDYQVKNAL